MEEKTKMIWKRIFQVLGVLIVLGILACAGLFLAGVAYGQFDWLGISIYIKKNQMNTDSYPTITNFDLSNNQVSLKWAGVGNFSNSSGFTDPITNDSIPNTMYGYAIIPSVNGKKQYTSSGSSNVVYVPESVNNGKNTYTLTSSDISKMNITLTQPGLGFYVVPYAQYYYMGQPGTITSIGGSPESFNNFNKRGGKEKITHLKLHKPMYIRGPDSLKNLNSSSKLPHHGPKVGISLKENSLNETPFQAPF